MLKHTGHPGKPGKGRTEPLVVRGKAAPHQHAGPHQVPAQPGRDHGRSEFVASLRTPAWERLFLADPRPLTGEHVAPDIIRIPGQRRAGRMQTARGSAGTSTSLKPVAKHR